MKAATLAVALIAPALAWGEIPSVYTDAEASLKAKAMIAEAEALHKNVTQLCSAGATPELYKAAKHARIFLDDWPDNHLKYRALFPYGDCKQAMIDVASFATTCAIGSYKGEAARHNQARWIEDRTACKEAIQNPDLSLKEW